MAGLCQGPFPMDEVGELDDILCVDTHIFCHFYRFFMVVRHGVLWTYVQRVYGRTSLGSMDVRPWVLGRTSIDALNEREQG